MADKMTVNIRITGELEGTIASDNYARLVAMLHMVARDFGLAIIEEE